MNKVNFITVFDGILLKGRMSCVKGCVWGWGAESAVPPTSISKQTLAHTQKRAHFSGVDIFTAGG